MGYINLIIFIMIFVLGCFGSGLSEVEKAESDRQNEAIEVRIDSLLALMTIKEKLGQLNFVVGDLFNSGPTVMTRPSDKFDSMIRRGEITGIFNIHGAEYIAELQKLAVQESRLGIPLLIGADIIHGFKTVMPIPLGEAASWDLEAIERSAVLAAREASAGGINWTFAPMVDLSRDARWGRVAEGAGEDPYLASTIAAARVRGFQGQDIASDSTLAACVKHFAAYGAPVAGRDYNTVDMSEVQFRNNYLLPYKAGIKAGAASVMTAFNEFNGIPCTANNWLLREILREEWGFDGVVVSDWQSITEMIAHGYSENDLHAAIQSINASCDVDMMADAYLKLGEALESGQIDEAEVDHAVRRVLRMKFNLGLFEDPMRYTSPKREENRIRTEEARRFAREIAAKSICLLKNEKDLLPLDDGEFTIALIGPFASDRAEHNGTWSFFGEPQDVVTIEEGVKQKLKKAKLLVAEGTDMYKSDEKKFQEALDIASRSDVIVACLGEAAVQNGEAGSRADIRIPHHQRKLLKALDELDKDIVLVLTHGRPIELSWESQNIEAILASWTLGSEAGNAIADVLFGDHNPSGRLPMSFPRHVGQVPIYYNAKTTGRPYEGNYDEAPEERVYRSKYRDVKNSPLYPFGYGLSYTQFVYGDLELSSKSLAGSDSLVVSVNVKNTGGYDGEECVQLYIQDVVASITRPARELKAFKKVWLEKDQSKTVSFALSSEDLKYFHPDNGWIAEPGQFKVYVGENSETSLTVDFYFESYAD